MCVTRFPVRGSTHASFSSQRLVACVVFQAEQTAFFSPKPRSRRLGRLRAHHREARGAFRRPQPRETGPEGESPIELYSRRTKKRSLLFLRRWFRGLRRVKDSFRRLPRRGVHFQRHGLRCVNWVIYGGPRPLRSGHQLCQQCQARVTAAPQDANGSSCCCIKRGHWHYHCHCRSVW